MKAFLLLLFVFLFLVVSLFIGVNTKKISRKSNSNLDTKDELKEIVKMKFLKTLFKRKPKQTTFCYCPKCNHELISSNSFISDEELVTYKCTSCSHVTEWLFDAPVPIIIHGK